MLTRKVHLILLWVNDNPTSVALIKQSAQTKQVTDTSYPINNESIWCALHTAKNTGLVLDVNWAGPQFKKVSSFYTRTSNTSQSTILLLNLTSTSVPFTIFHWCYFQVQVFFIGHTHLSINEHVSSHILSKNHFVLQALESHLYHWYFHISAE